MKNNHRIILDCTLRDGGYYNNWDFSPEFVRGYLDCISSSGVKVVELGFRSGKNEKFVGPFAYTTDEFIGGLDLPSNLKYGVMINGKELTGDMDKDSLFLQKLFPINARDSKIKLVRIACHIHELLLAIPAINWLKYGGYEVGLNLMQITTVDLGVVKKYLREISKSSLDVFYFADSLGSLTPEMVPAILSAIKSEWSGPIGIHAHDNLGLAMANSLKANQCGATWLDSTLTGMGRGPGNVKTEELLIEASISGWQEISLTSVLQFIKEYLHHMKIECGWGTNPYYYLSGKHEIHPTYIQEMIGDSRFESADILSVIDFLKTSNSKSFKQSTLSLARLFMPDAGLVGDFRPQSVIGGREVVILGAGESLKACGSALENYIKSEKPFVIALNATRSVSEDLINLRVTCHPVRMISDVKKYEALNQNFVMPAPAIEEGLTLALKNKRINIYGIKVEPEKLEAHDGFCILPNTLAIGYALAIAHGGDAKRILLAGFDGYGPNDPRTHEVQSTLNLFLSNAVESDLISVTPTDYRLQTKSIYGM